MRNPFTIPLVPTGVGYPDESFDFPSRIDLDSVSYPELNGLGGGVSAYRDSQAYQFQSDNPAYAGEYQLGYLNAPGIVMPNADLRHDIIGREDDDGRNPGTNRIIHSIGPVTGRDNGFSGIRDELVQPNPGYAGPVSGGSDYAQQLAASYFASQALAYSEQASAQAMVSAV